MTLALEKAFPGKVVKTEYFRFWGTDLPAEMSDGYYTEDSN
jgi:hypothetical protein